MFVNTEIGCILLQILLGNAGCPGKVFTMKIKSLHLVIAVVAILVLAGCEDAPNGWYKTNGGYINLNRVSNIETYGKVEINSQMIFNGGLSRVKIAQLRENIKKSDSTVKVSISGNINFDKNYVVDLPAGSNISREEALTIIDDWDMALARLERQLPE